MTTMKVSITGLGWLGLPLAKSLQSQGFNVSGSTRTHEKIEELERFGLEVELLNENSLPSKSLLDADVVVLNIPPFEAELDWFKSWPWNKNTHVIFISSTSVYGEEPREVSEVSELQPVTKNALILVEEENWIKSSFKNWTILRPSGLIGSDRHPGKSLKGKTNMKGKDHQVNLVHQDDVIGFIELVIKNKITSEVFNVSSDESRTREQMYGKFADFDQNDSSRGKIILNKKMKSIYKLLKPTIS